MFRIQTNDQARVVTFRLEGRLEGPWVPEVEECWRSILDASKKPTIIVDLAGVTHIDVAGKAQLAAMHANGAQFLADDCLTRAIVAEIVGHE